MKSQDILVRPYRSCSPDNRHTFSLLECMDLTTWNRNESRWVDICGKLQNKIAILNWNA